MNLKHELLDKLVILKLNGGLGTTLGCEGPKSAIEVRQDMSFLDLTVRQVEYLNSLYGVDVPLVLMNSFNTHEETVRIIRKYRMHNLSIHTFNQSCFPFIVQDTMLPLPNTKFDRATRDKWYPPGHGDVYHALFESGLLENLINQGKEYIFISNVDNLGATVNLDILYHMINEDSEFVMEVTDKTRADVQGGTLVTYKGKPHLLEASQVPGEHMDDFRSIAKFQTFNTNNLWVNLRAVQRLVAQDSIDIEPLVSVRTVKNTKVVQLETAAGEAIHHFKNFIGIKVPRARFLPVKSSSDLFLAQSNLYQIKHGSLLMHPDRGTPTIPIVKLGLEFQSQKEYAARFAKGIPNILELDHLTVAGDIMFGSDVTLKVSHWSDAVACREVEKTLTMAVCDAGHGDLGRERRCTHRPARRHSARGQGRDGQPARARPLSSRMENSNTSAIHIHVRSISFIKCTSNNPGHMHT